MPGTNEEAAEGIFRLRDGHEVVIRGIRPDDWTRLTELHRRLSAETQRLRFFVRMARLRPAFAKQLATVDFVDRAAFVACDPASGDLHAVGRYERVTPNAAAIAFVVEDRFQGRGLGPELFDRLVALARRNGIGEFRAEVLVENRRMISLLKEAGYPCGTSVDGTVETLVLDIGAERAPATPPGEGQG
ncbi:MAG: N-acetyltransferase [Chloroflexi bacterium CFX7]|nr:N-acetyltransferase [Chloroflexi bacterium CFX7]MCK6565683.1 GNAT family N-acetyltransferase [Dehalococcoidia bacterium]RIL03810.1 MAG: hypothetical protein DCC78_03395 [bacterium]